MIRTYIQARLGRRLSPQSMGPNEARIAYDLAVGVIAVLISIFFGALFLPQFDWKSEAPLLLLLPVFLFALTWLFGIYSRLKAAQGRVKAAVLFAAVLFACAAEYGILHDPAPIILWGLLAYAPLALARLLLGLPHSKHKTLSSIAVNQRGPVLVIGGAGYIGSHTVDLLLQSG